MTTPPHPIFCIPGWGLGRGPLKPLAESIGAHFLDLPGYAGTPENTHFESCLQRYAQALPPNSILCGWSLGTLVALGLAQLTPERVSGLILIAGTPSFIQRPDWSAGQPPSELAQFTQAIATNPASALPHFVRSFNRGDLHSRQVTQALLANADNLPPTSTLLTGLAWLESIDLRAPLSENKIQMPSLLIHGEQDPLIPATASRWLASQVPASRLMILEDCAHAPHTSQPETVTRCIQNFLADM